MEPLVRYLGIEPVEKVPIDYRSIESPVKITVLSVTVTETIKDAFGGP